MKILVPHIVNHYDGRVIRTYSDCIVRELRNLGHEVTEVSKDRFANIDDYKQYDLLLDIDCGKDTDHSYKFHLWDGRVPIKSAVILIDSHGKADEHVRIARHADHVFFAVWDKRDIFTDHPSVTWFPNFTDLEHFNNEQYGNGTKTFDFCFFGTKGGLERANKLKEICQANNWTFDIDEIGRKGKHRWPGTAERMAACKFGFNHGQKHDGPNLRVMETMAMQLPLISDVDARSGMGYLFEPWQHFIPYTAYTYEGLQERLQWCLDNPEKAEKIAQQAYEEVKINHLTEHRVKTLLEVINVKV